MKGLRIQAKWESPRSQRGGTIRRRGKSCFPRSTLVFRADTVSPPRPPCSPLHPIRARCRKSFFPFSFFSFFPFHPNLSAATSPSPPPRLALTQAISRRCRHQPRRRHLDTTTTAPTPWPLQPPPRHPLRACQLPVAPALTRVVGTRKPPRCRRPHCS